MATELQNLEQQPLSVNTGDKKTKDYYQTLLSKESKIQNLTKCTKYYRCGVVFGAIIIILLIITIIVMVIEYNKSDNSTPVYIRDNEFFMESSDFNIMSLSLNIYDTTALYAANKDTVFLFDTTTGKLINSNVVEIKNQYQEITDISYSADNTDNDDTLWISDASLFTVSLYNIITGKIDFTLGTENENGNGTHPIQFDKISSAHYDRNGLLYVGDGYIDSLNHRIIAYDIDDDVLKWSTYNTSYFTESDDIYDLSADSFRSWLWVSDRNDKSIKVFRMWWGKYLGKIDCLNEIGNGMGANCIKYFATSDWLIIGQESNQLVIIDISSIGTDPTMIDLYQCKNKVIFSDKFDSNLVIEAIEVNLNNNDLYVALSSTSSNTKSMIYRYVKN